MRLPISPVPMLRRLTIVIALGTYNLSAPLYINGSFTNVGIRGATGNRDDVVLVGKGMSSPNDGGASRTA